MLPILKFIFASLTFSFVHKLQSENTIFLVTENIFHSGIDGNALLVLHYILLVLS